MFCLGIIFKARSRAPGPSLPAQPADLAYSVSLIKTFHMELLSDLQLIAWKLPPIRRVPANWSSPVHGSLIETSRKGIRGCGTKFHACSVRPGLSEFRTQQALIQTVHFLDRVEMNL